MFISHDLSKKAQEIFYLDNISHCNLPQRKHKREEKESVAIVSLSTGSLPLKARTAVSGEERLTEKSKWYYNVNIL